MSVACAAGGKTVFGSTPIACAAGGKGEPPPLHPRPGTSSLVRLDANCLRGGRQGRAAAPAPPARDFVPWIPDSMHSYAKRLTHMLAGKLEQAAIDAISRHTI